MPSDSVGSEERSRGCLVGLACGDALGRPVEFRTAGEISREHGEVTEMLGDGTHGQPAGTVTDDTELALCIGESLVDRRGFDPVDVGDRFVDWLDSGPFDIGLMTRDSLSRLRQGTPWHEAGVEVWEARSEGSNAGNGSVMRCAPHALAFRHFEDELAHVSRLSSAITHADPRCQWGCVLLNRTLANLVSGVDDPLGTALGHASRTVPDELDTALSRVHETLIGDRDTETLEEQLGTSGYVVDTLQTALYHGLAADSFERAVVRAVNGGGDTDTIGAIAGAVAGARFGRAAIPERWTEDVAETDRLDRLARELLTVRQKVPDTRLAIRDDGSLVFKERTIEGPAYIRAARFQRATIGHRPHPAPHRALGVEYDEFADISVAALDWERRAYAVYCGRYRGYTGPLPTSRGVSERRLPDMVPVPQYPFVDSFAELPPVDQQRIERDAREVGEAFIRAYIAFTSVRATIVGSETEEIGIERMDPMAAATRVITGTFGDTSRVLFGERGGGTAVPEEIRAERDVAVAERTLCEEPDAVYELGEVFPELASGTRAILDYVSQLRYDPQERQTGAVTDPEEQVSGLRTDARTMVGELHVTYESLRRVAIRHPGVESRRWEAARE